MTRVHSLARAALQERGIGADGLYSKHLHDYAGQQFDVVITVCDRARDACPVFPGATAQVHWSLPDPSVVVGTDEERLDAFRSVRDTLTARLLPFIETQKGRQQITAATSMEGDMSCKPKRIQK